MSKSHNNAGRTIVADRFIELLGSSSNNATTRIKQTINSQVIDKNIENLRNELDKIADDGTITVSEKPGLKREWSSLQSSYTSVAEQFTSNPELQDNAAFSVLRSKYNALSDLMNKILADMTTDYVGGDEVKKISDDFAGVYEQLTVCQTILNSISDFVKNYSINITGNRDALNGSTITAGIYREGIEQQNPEYIDGSNYTWLNLDDEDWTPVHGKSILIKASELPVSPCRFTVTWEDKEEQDTSLSILFEMIYGTFVQYAWSNAETEDGVRILGDGSWYDVKPDKPSNMTYLWRRESSDNKKTWQYFRETGDTGAEGPAGADGVPGYSMSLTADSALFNATADGVVSSSELGFISQVIIYKGYDVEKISDWTLSVVSDKPTGIAATISAEGAISVTAFSASVDGGTLTVTATKETTSLTKIISIAKVKAGAGGDGSGYTKYYYKWTKTDDPDAYLGGGILFVRKSSLLAVGSTLLTAGMAGWAEHVPQGPQYEDDFLWMKQVHPDGTIDIIPPAKKGEPAYDIRIVASQTSYQLTSRDIVANKTDFVFSLERNYVSGEATWSLNPSNVESQLTGTVDENNPDIFHVSIMRGSSLSYFEVSVKCADFEITRTLRITGVDGGEETPYYFKIYPLSDSDPLPIYNKEQGTLDWNGADANLPKESPEGPLITGDYLLHKVSVIKNASDTEPSIEPVPFYYDYDTDEWLMLDADSPNYSETMGTVLADVVNMPDMPVTTGALFGFFQNFAAQNAFIDFLKANTALINAFKTENFLLEKDRMRMKIGIFNDTPVFQAEYKNDTGDYVTIFMVHFSSGNIFFGEPNNNFSAPLHGFMYRASDKYLVGPDDKFKLSDNGELEAINANISGEIKATSGTFSGLFNCKSIKTEEGDTNTNVYNVSDVSSTQVASIFYALSLDPYNLNIGGNYNDNPFATAVECTIEQVPLAKWISIGYGYPDSISSPQKKYVNFYDESHRLLQTDDNGNTWNAIEITASNRSEIATIWEGESIQVNFAITIISSGDILVVNVPISPSDEEIQNYQKGQVFITTSILDSYGSLRVKL